MQVGDIGLLEGTNVDVNALGITVDQINAVALATTGTVTDVIMVIQRTAVTKPKSRRSC